MSAPGSCTPRPRRAFYCVADRCYFIGAVALLNSLRVVGHSEPLIVLDRGLEPGQRAALEPVATVLSAAGSGHGRLSKALAPLAWPAAEVLAIVDADVIAVRSLDALLERAAEGQVVAFADDQPERFHPEWRRALRVSKLHRHTYVNAGLLLLPGDLAPVVLARVSELHERVDFSRSRGFGRGTMADPFRLPDQDCWNVALAGTVEPSRMTVLDRALARSSRGSRRGSRMPGRSPAASATGGDPTCSTTSGPNRGGPSARFRRAPTRRSCPACCTGRT